MTNPAAPPDPVRRGRRLRRRLLTFALVMVLLPVATIVALPTLLSTPQGNAYLVGRLNAVLAPGRIEVDALRLSWTEPTVLRGLTLRDGTGRPVLVSGRGGLDRNFLALLRRPFDAGTLTLEDSRMTLTRTASGSLNLEEALGRVFDRPDPRRDLKIRIVGSVAVAALDPARPVGGEAMDFLIHFRPYPEELEWTLAVAEPVKGAKGRLKANGRADRWRTLPDSRESQRLTAEVRLADWPVAAKIEGADLAGALDADFNVVRTAGAWTSNGGAELLSRLVDGRPIAPGALKAKWSTRLDAVGLVWNGEVVADRIGGVEGPFLVRLDAALDAKADRLRVDAFGVKTPLGDFDASGTIDRPRTDRVVDLRGKLSPRFDLMTARLAERVEPNAKIVGKPSEWSLRGSVPALAKAALRISGGLTVDELDVYGMRLGATNLRATFENGVLTVDPIDTTLNGGRLRLKPAVDLGAPGGAVVRLGNDASLTDAEINDEVSHRVLSFVAPVLDKATQVNGRVSARIASAEFPVSRSVGKKAVVEGLVEFRDVTFAAGPFSKELLALVVKDEARLESPLLKLDRPVNLTIADGRITQRGLSLPIGSVARVEVEGWVDFDRRLGLEATLPLNPSLFAKAPLLNGVVRSAKVRVPIGGTLDQPRIDASAFKANLAEMGKDVLAETGVQGLSQLLSAIAKPRDPAAVAQAKEAAERRKAERIRKREERVAKKKQKSST